VSTPYGVTSTGVAYYPAWGFVEKISTTETTATTIPGYSALAIDTAGNFWSNSADVAPGKTTLRNEVHKDAPDGSELGNFALPFPAARIKSDGSGGQVVHGAADGTVGLPLGVTATDFCIDANRNLWVAGGPTLLKLAPDGTQLGSYPIKALRVAFGDGYIFAGVASTPSSVLKIQP
jgi:sugar lactone lactonase YvrE